MAVAPPMPQQQHPQQHLQQPGEPPLGSPELPSKGSALHAYRALEQHGDRVFTWKNDGYDMVVPPNHHL